MGNEIKQLQPSQFEQCAALWNINKQPQLAERFYNDLCSGNRLTWVCEQNGALLGEISLVFDMHDPDYTILQRRAYVSHLIVKKDCRRKGIGKALITHVTRQAEQMGLKELTIGVDLDNYPSLKLYTGAGFDRVLLVDEDGQGRYVKLMKTL